MTNTKVNVAKQNRFLARPDEWRSGATGVRYSTVQYSTGAQLGELLPGEILMPADLGKLSTNERLSLLDLHQ